MFRAAITLLVLLLSAAVSGGGPATAKGPFAVRAKVTRVVSAELLDVRLASGETERLRIAGIDAPAAGECFGRQATALASRLVPGRDVRVTVDGAGVRRDRNGRLVAYVTLPSKADLGRLLVARGAAQIDAWGASFTRFAPYVPVQQRAELANRGLWDTCSTDVAVSMQAGPNPVAAGGTVTYTLEATNLGRRAAPGVVLALRPPRGAVVSSAASERGTCAKQDWRASCAVGRLAPGETVTATFAVEMARPGTAPARASVRFAWCLRSPCGAAPLRDSNSKNDEAAALTTVLVGTPPPPPPPTGPPPPPGPPPAGSCHPSYPAVCIPPPPPDLDCADVVPNRDIYVRHDVPDPDPHLFDGNQDGLGCQFDDY